MPFPTVAGANIRTSRVVAFGSQPGQVVEASDPGDSIAGISQEAPRRAIPDDGFAAVVGEAVRVYFTGEICLAVAGSAVSYGSELTSDSQGRVVPVSASSNSSNTSVVGVALQSATAAGEKIKVLVNIKRRWPS